MKTIIFVIKRSITYLAGTWNLILERMEQDWLRMLWLCTITAILSFLTYMITKKIVLKAIEKLVTSTKTPHDDLILERKVFHRLALIIPPALIYLMSSQYPYLSAFFQKAAMVWMVLVFTRVLSSLFNVAGTILERSRRMKDMALSSIVQAFKLLAYLLGFIFMFSIILDKSPWGIISGIGALSAILLLMFKDTILSFVAGMQITLNKKMKVGDWIQMDKYNVDGSILDISLNMIKVQNWDKTIISIPTFKFLEEPFKNWRGMEESGGRRIKRSILLDQTSIRFCTDEMLENLMEISCLNEYLTSKQKEIKDYNAQRKEAGNHPVNFRKQTNIGIFRNYLEYYLRNRTDIHQEGMTLMVRQLEPGSQGLPLQIYCFTKTTAWVDFEKIQADIMDHILAVLREFELRIFQSPTGADLTHIRNIL